jgi:hypothetical protein
MRPPIDEENCVSVNDHIAPGTCNGCDVGRHYEDASDRAGCVCCRTVDEWVEIRAGSAAGPTELDRTEGDLAVAVREASTARAENERLRLTGEAIERGREWHRARADNALAERDALSAVIDKAREIAESWRSKRHWGDIAADEIIAVLAAGLAAPVAPNENACHECGIDNPVWFAPNKLWNRVMGGPDATDDPGGFLCPICFIRRAQASGVVPTGWLLTEEAVAAPVGDPEAVDPKNESRYQYAHGWASPPEPVPALRHVADPEPNCPFHWPGGHGAFPLGGCASQPLFEDAPGNWEQGPALPGEPVGETPDEPGVFETRGGKSYLDSLMILNPMLLTLDAIAKVKAEDAPGPALPVEEQQR